MIVCLNAISNQAFWQLPPRFERAILARLPSKAQLVVARTLPELTGALRRSTIALGWPFPAAMARGARDLAWVHFFTAGVPESWQRASIRVTTHRGGARSVAEHALLLTIALLRGVTHSSFATWSPDGLFVPRATERMHGAVFGAGAVGREIVRLVSPLFATVTAVSRHPPSEPLAEGVMHAPAWEWKRVLSVSEIVLLALPLTAETRAFVGSELFGGLRPGTLLVNVASGALVEEAAVLAFLARDGTSRYAADVAHPEPYPADGALYMNRQVLLTPHVGARREDAWPAIEKRAIEALDEALAYLS